jgi:Flp pilus assembly protein TadD
MEIQTRRLELTVCLFLLVATAAVFWQVRSHDFLNLDDQRYVTENRHVQAGLTRDGIIWAFTTTHAEFWHPLTWLSHMLDCHLYGLNAGSHHLTNLILHIMSTILLFVVLKRMSGALWKSAFVAALFSLHPLHVESVAWVAERKDVLCTFFWMLTMWTYVRYAERPGPQRYLLVLLTFALGLMSKPMLVTLPFVLLLLDYWPLGRLKLRWRDHVVRSPQTSHHTDPGAKKSAVLALVLEKVPFLALAAAVSIATLFAQPSGGSAMLPLKIRIGNAFLSYLSYIAKMLWPQELAAFYPHPAYTLQIWEVIGAAVLLICISVFVIRAVRMRPYLTVGWLWYLGTLVPVIGLVQVGSHAMADRYTYVPLIGLFLMIAWGVPEIVKRFRPATAVLPVLAGAMLSALTVCTWLQLRHWKNSSALFTHALNVTASNSLAHTNLGVALDSQGRLEEAMSHYREALRIKPHDADAHHNLGVALAKHGRLKEAMSHYREALRSRPDYADAHHNLGVALAKQGRLKEAASHYIEALRIKPDYAKAHNNLGVHLANEGRLKQAVNHYTEALRTKPDYAEAHYNLGNALARQGRPEEAISHYFEALRIKPDYAKVHNNLGAHLASQGNLKEAVNHYTEALRIKPDFAEAHNNLGAHLASQGSFKEAISHFSEALRIKPHDADAHQNLESTMLLMSKSAGKSKTVLRP